MEEMMTINSINKNQEALNTPLTHQQAMVHIATDSITGVKRNLAHYRKVLKGKIFWNVFKTETNHDVAKRMVNRYEQILKHYYNKN